MDLEELIQFTDNFQNKKSRYAEKVLMGLYDLLREKGATKSDISEYKGNVKGDLLKCKWPEE